MNRVKLQPSVIRFLKISSSHAIINGNDYYYHPFWYKSTDVKNIMEVYSADDIPTELKDFLSSKEGDYWAVSYKKDIDGEDRDSSN